jgi:uncharacterized membrane protein YgaE (UPF0421/DUF939 family)
MARMSRLPGKQSMNSKDRRNTDANVQALTRGLQLAVRAAVAAGLSLVLAQFLELEYPLYAFIAAVIVTDLSPSQTRQLGLRRIVATVVGAVCGAALSPLLPPEPWSIGLGVLAAMLLSNLLHVDEGAKVAGYICGIVLLAYGSEPWSYAFYRLVETILGIVAALVVSLVPKLIRVEEPGRNGA